MNTFISVEAAPILQDETYRDVKKSECSIRGRIVRGQNIRGCNVQGLIILVP
jgi:hypothetical protein